MANGDSRNGYFSVAFFIGLRQHTGAASSILITENRS